MRVLGVVVSVVLGRIKLSLRSSIALVIKTIESRLNLRVVVCKCANVVGWLGSGCSLLSLQTW